MHHKSYEVWISCDGEPLPEYRTQPEGDDGKTITCFIPSERGKNFVIHWKDGALREDLALDFMLDGKKLTHGAHCARGNSGKRSGVLTDASVEQPFQFANLHTSDDDALLEMQAGLSELGSIKASIQRVFSDYRVIPFHSDSFKSVGAVHERSKKAGAHNVSLGQGKKIAPHTYLTKHDPVDPSEGYVAHFIFRYRPLDLLQAQDIVPPTSRAVKPEPIAGPSSQNENRSLKRSNSNTGLCSSAKRPRRNTPTRDLGVIEISDDEDDSMQALQRRLRESERQLRALRNKVSKQHSQSGGRSTSGNVKKEPRDSQTSSAGNDVIDLSSD